MTQSPYLFKRRNYGLIAICFIVLFLVGAIFSFYLFDIILAKMVPRLLNLGYKTKERRIYTNPSFPLTFSVYLFDVLNKDEVQNGAKPHLKEIGPYVFDEHLRKVNIIDDDELDTMEFDDFRTYTFRPDLSKNLTGNEIITTIHPVLIGLGMTVHFEFRQFMRVAKSAIKEIFHEPTDVFWTGRAMDLMFHGIQIDCDVNKPMAQIACDEIRDRKDPQFRLLDDGKMMFSMFAGQNNTATTRWKIYRGIKNIYEAGYTVEVNGKRALNIWGDENPDNNCNKIVGTDGILISPFRNKDEGITFYSWQLCATLHMDYKRMAHFRGIDVHVFELKFENQLANNTCFCREPDDCPPKGTMNIFPCVKAPVVASHPHFYLADPSLLANVASGLNPVEKLHEFVFNIELIAGIDVNPYARAQVNFELEPVKEIQVMSKLPKMLFPLLWFEESADIPDNMINLLKYYLTLGVKAHSLAKWFTMTVSLFCAIFYSSLYLLQKFSILDIFEEERTFKRSPNAILKIATVLPISSEEAFKANKDDIIMRSLEQNTNENETNFHDVANTNAMLLLSEVVEEASKASRIQQQKSVDEQ